MLARETVVPDEVDVRKPLSVELIAEAKADATLDDVLPFPQEAVAVLLLIVTETEPLS